MGKGKRSKTAPGFGKKLLEQARRDKKAFAIYFILRLIVLVSAVLAFIRGDYESLFFCVLTLVLFLLPSLVELSLRIDLPTSLEIIIFLFIFAAEILGELQAYYVRFAFWDTMLHTVNGFLCAAIGFALIDIMNRSERFSLKLSPLYVAVAAFCFSMTIGVLWEFFEFGMDVFFQTDMQKDFVVHRISSVSLDPTKSNHPVVIDNITDVVVNGQSLGLGGYLDIGLIDTMKDLLVNFVGAVVFSIIGFFHVRSRGHGRVASQFIPRVETEPQNSEADKQ